MGAVAMLSTVTVINCHVVFLYVIRCSAVGYYFRLRACLIGVLVCARLLQNRVYCSVVAQYQLSTQLLWPTFLTGVVAE